jgi:mycothiol synthase
MRPRDISAAGQGGSKVRSVSEAEANLLLHTACVLSEGLISRAPQRGDLEEVAALTTACDLADLGKPMITKEDIEAQWSQPNFNLDRDAIVVLDGNGIVAHAETFRTRAEVAIHPSMRGLGTGTWLLAWLETRGREKGESKSRQSILDRRQSAAAFLRSKGYEVGYVSWILEKATTDEPIEQEAPPGVHIRNFIPGRDETAVFRVIEDAFNEWPDREPTSFEDWAAVVVQRSDFDAGLLHVAVEGGQVVGACVGLNDADGGWVQQLAVKASHRKRGIAAALLRRAFHTAWERGQATCGVSTDSRTGALGLYQRAGMHVNATATNYVKPL